MEDNKIGHLQIKLREQQEEIDKLKETIIKINEIDSHVTKEIRKLNEDYFDNLKKESLETAEKKFEEKFNAYVIETEKRLLAVSRSSSKPVEELLKVYHSEYFDKLDESTKEHQVFFNAIFKHIQMLEKILFKKNILDLDETNRLEDSFNKTLLKK